ncbi:Uncharacterized protein FKW44_004941 [Caligus rogercresseyi]|uniref:Uncharacterized protein n=1 Tax=Caligus rogercresseyi TaxID=217165 RepID=A0A7T8HMA7_CALRO|nr:Uncharacterized protein FKW44_004941 [Caligus rogercresseyi]
MEKIRSELYGQPLWISLDGSIDVVGREVVNVLIGRLDGNSFHVPFVVKCSFVPTSDSNTMAQ